MFSCVVRIESLAVSCPEVWARMYGFFTSCYYRANRMPLTQSVLLLQLLHRDLAVRSVLIDDKMICKLCDFGTEADITELRENNARTKVREMVRVSIRRHIVHCDFC